MALTVCEQALAAAFARLQAIASIAELTADRIERNPDTAIEEFPRLRQFDGAHSVVDRWAGIEMVRQLLDVELCAAADAPGTAVQELYGAVKTALAADHTLGGIAFDLREAGMDDPALISSAAGSLGGAVVTFEIDLLVKESDPTALAP